ncbi:MAG: transcription termination factor NusA [Acidobacteriota bacterium]
MASLLAQTIDQISKEKNIDPQIIISALEDAMVAAAKKYFKTEEDLQSRFDVASGALEVFAVKRVVAEVSNPLQEMSLEEAKEIDDSFEVDDTVEIPKPTDLLGRIAAQTAKQVIFQKVREAEREIVYNEYSDRVGELVNGIVRRLEGSDIIVDLGRTEAVLPYPEQSRSESYKQGDRIRAVIVRVLKSSKGSQVVVSRGDPSLLMRMFEMEIPEIYDQTIVIRNAVREAGERAKVAVQSRDRDVDPVGACVGMKGSRINAVIRELRGEKIDIIQYHDEISQYAVNALNPAKIGKVLIADPINKVLEVIVQEDQLSLAIGKKGQNVRLASKLLGWQIEIKSEEEKRREVADEIEKLTSSYYPLSELEGVTERMISKLQEAGYSSVEELSAATAEDLQNIPGIGEKTAEKILATALEFMASAGEGASAEEDSEEEQDEEEVAEETAAAEGDKADESEAEDGEEEVPVGDGSGEDSKG